MTRRFWKIWSIFAGFYTLLAVLGPNGLLPSAIWPDINQHLLLTRAWLGEDIVLPATATVEPSRIAVAPRLDVTPYFKHRVISDPRDNAMLSNLAIGIPDETGELMPAQAVLSLSPDDPALLDRVVCHVGFPPGPAFLLLPFRLILRGALASQWMSAILGGLGVALMDRLFAMWPAIRSDLRTPMVVLCGIGTLWLWLTPNGGTNLFAQVVASTGLAAALLLLISKRWFLAGTAIAIALTSRVSMVGVLPLALWIIWSKERRRMVPALVSFSVAPAIAAGLTMALNARRFGSVFDFGYRHMFTPPDVLNRMLEHGQLSFVFFSENFRYFFLQPPMLIRDSAGHLDFPFLASDPFGMGIFFVTPAFLAMIACLRPSVLRQPGHLALWISLVLICLPGLLYFNTGWVQWGARFLLDAWPLFLLLTAVGLERLPRALMIALIAGSCLSNLWAVLLTTLRIWPGCCS